MTDNDKTPNAPEAMSLEEFIAEEKPDQVDHVLLDKAFAQLMSPSRLLLALARWYEEQLGESDPANAEAARLLREHACRIPAPSVDADARNLDRAMIPFSSTTGFLLAFEVWCGRVWKDHPETPALLSGLREFIVRFADHERKTL